MSFKEVLNVEEKFKETGVFNKLNFSGKDINIDNFIKEAKDDLLNIQTNLESVFLNGDREKAKSNIIRRNRGNQQTDKRKNINKLNFSLKMGVGPVTQKLSPFDLDRYNSVKTRVLNKNVKVKDDILPLDLQKINLLDENKLLLQLGGSTDMKKLINMNKNKFNSNFLKKKSSFNSFNKNTLNNFLMTKSNLKTSTKTDDKNGDKFSNKLHKGQILEKIEEKLTNNSILPSLNKNNNSLSNINNNQTITTKSNNSIKINSIPSQVKDSGQILIDNNLKGKERNQLSSHCVSISNDFITTNYKSGFNQSSFNFSTKKNLTSSIFKSSLYVNDEKNRVINNINNVPPFNNENQDSARGKNCNSNFLNNTKKKHSNDKMKNVSNQIDSQKQIKDLIKNDSLSDNSSSYIETCNSNIGQKRNDTNEITSKFINIQNSSSIKINQNSDKKIPKFDLNINGIKNNPNTHETRENSNRNLITFNRTFHTNSISNTNSISFNNVNICPNININNNSFNTEFFSTQVFNVVNMKKKKFLPHLIEGFKSIENDMTDINMNLSKAVKDLDESIEKGEKNKGKHVKEFTFDTDNSDVFLYGNNGEGYYMSNQKVFKESVMLTRMKCENIHKHKAFFVDRFNLDTKDDLKVNDGLSRHTENNFKKIEEYLYETEEMKKRAIKNIELHQYKNKMEELKEKEEENNENDLNY